MSLKSNQTQGPSGYKVAVATPCYGGVLTHTYEKSMMFTIPYMMGQGISFSALFVPSESIISKARNALVHEFLKTDGTHLWFIDADMGWDPQALVKLIMSGKDVVGAAGPRKQEPISFAGLLESPMQTCPDTGLTKASSLGTGCLVIARRVFEAIKDNFPDNYYFDYGTNEKIYNFFEMKIFKNMFWSEDYTFCHKCRELGIDIWADTKFSLDHVGQKTFTGAWDQALSSLGLYFINKDYIPTSGDS